MIFGGEGVRGYGGVRLLLFSIHLWFPLLYLVIDHLSQLLIGLLIDR